MQEDTCDLNEVEGSSFAFLPWTRCRQETKEELDRAWLALPWSSVSLLHEDDRVKRWSRSRRLQWRDERLGVDRRWRFAPPSLLLDLCLLFLSFCFFFPLRMRYVFFLFFHSDWGSDGDWVLWGLDFGFGGVVWDAWLDCGFGQGGYWIGMIRNLGFWRIVWVRSGSDSEIRFVLDLGFDDVGKGGGVWGWWRIGFDWDKELTGRPRQGFYFLFFAG